MSVATPFFNPTLESVTQAFDHWRTTRSKRARTPAGLQHHAAALLSLHPASHICSALKINNTTLKRWEADSSSAHTLTPLALSPFIKLPTAAVSTDEPAPDCKTLFVELGYGIELHVDGHFTLEQILNVAHSFKKGARL